MISQEEIEYIQWREDTDAMEAKRRTRTVSMREHARWLAAAKAHVASVKAKAVTRKAMADYADAHPLLAAYLDSLADYSDSEREEINYSH